MYINRRYKKLPWFDLLDQIDLELKDLPAKERYIELLDELRMRKIESVSEGGTYKLKAPSKELVAKFEARISSEADFASSKDLEECRQILKDIL